MNLEKLLKDTYWGSSAEFNYASTSGWYFNSNPMFWSLDKIDLIRNPTGGNPILQFQNLKYNGKVVCEHIDFKNTSITYREQDVDEQTYDLPFLPEFILKQYSVLPGSACMDSNFWNAAQFHAGFLVVFGYELTSDGQLVPISQQIYDSDDFMPAPGQAAPGLNTPLTAGQSGQVTMEPLRVVVCAEVICMPEKSDFEPTGALNAVRLHPHAMIVSNMDLAKATTVIEIMRPAMSNHMHSSDSSMGEYIKSAFFTDQNEVNPMIYWPPPINQFYDNSKWPQLFAYYHTDPAIGEGYKVIDSSKNARQILANRSLFKRLDDDNNPVYDTVNFGKEQYQGSFDNIHLAPPLNASNDLSPSFYMDADINKKVTNITMAPICQHDCLHIHWRWGTKIGSTGKSPWNGWDGNVPFAKPGAPMAQPNQSVNIQLLANGSLLPHGISYGATMQNIKRGVWQFVFHHGCAYAVSFSPNFINKPFFDHLAKNYLQPYIDEGLIPAPADNFPWSVFYLAIRYAMVKETGTQKLRLFDRVAFENPQGAVLG